MPVSERQPPLSLYRRHRPRGFADVVGQDTVVRTLQGAVARGRVHHAYLFVGSRGTGKTSMAKILAACLNCEHGAGGGTTEPCGVCESCVAIARATSLDVIEMDAASSNSVDDIRELRDSVAFAPVSGRHKVYILDEAHMLSTAAWNAFLKTLEEPPPDTVFVLATTEAARVPATVVDRCHRFDFARPTVEHLATVVRRAAAAESIDIPPEAVAAVARAATGSFRDALGTLEQLLSYSGPHPALEDVLAVLGVTDAAVLEATLDAVHAGDAREALLAVARCVESGRDAGAFAADLEVRARELLVVTTLGGVPPELALTAQDDARLAAQAARVGPATAVRLLEHLGSALEAVRAGGDPRTHLELALVRAARPEVDGSLRALLARVERLEERLGAGAGSSPAPKPLATEPVASAPPAAEQPTVAVGGGGAGVVVSEGGSLNRLNVNKGRPATPDPQPAYPPPAAEESTPAPSGAHPADDLLAAAGSPVAALVPAPEPPVADPVASVSPAAAEPVSAAPPVPPPAAAPPAGVEDLDALWPAVVEVVGADNKLLSAVLADARPLALSGEELTVGFAPSASFLKKKAEDAGHRMTVTEALRRVTGQPRLRVAYVLDEAPPLAPTPVEPRTEEEWVARFKEELDAEELVTQGGEG